MRHYSAGTAALTNHRAWMDGVVLISTVLFGLLLGSFFANVLPGRDANASFTDGLRRGPLSFLAPPLPTLPLKKVGEAQGVKSVVTQVAEVRRSNSEGGVDAAAGNVLVTATVVIDNQGTLPLVYGLNDWNVRDSRGRNRPAQAINAAGWLSSGRVQPGQQVQGAVSFLVPESEADVQVTFAPQALGAMLRWDAPAAPAEAPAEAPAGG